MGKEVSRCPRQGRIMQRRWKCESLSRVWLFLTPWTIACQAPPSMEFSRQEYWSRLSFSSPGDLSDPGIQLGLLHCRQTLIVFELLRKPKLSVVIAIVKYYVAMSFIQCPAPHQMDFFLPPVNTSIIFYDSLILIWSNNFKYQSNMKGIGDGAHLILKVIPNSFLNIVSHLIANTSLSTLKM